MGRLLFSDVESMVEYGQTVNEPISVVAQLGDTVGEVAFEGIGCMNTFASGYFNTASPEPLTVIAQNLGNLLRNEELSYLLGTFLLDLSLTVNHSFVFLRVIILL